MSKKKVYLYCSFTIILFFTWLILNSSDKNEDFTERVKISLREVGNQLLLVNQDSTSLILPVVKLDNSKYELSFQNKLSFEPKRLASIIDSVFTKAELSKHYRVETLNCLDKEVAHSYEIRAKVEHTIIACASRLLPKQCYTIEVKFTKRVTPFFNKQLLIYILAAIVIIFLFDVLFSRRKQQISESNNNVYNTLGLFRFYPEQNKLVKEAQEISLSKKECELLEIFVAHPNQIIKRDDLTKKVWEDHGVFVGRSLDTYISKLRKKLKDDDSIKLTNIHGVGYKLEVNNTQK